MKKLIGILMLFLFLTQASFAIDTRPRYTAGEDLGTKKNAIARLYNFFKSYDTVKLKAVMTLEVGLTNNPNIQYMVDKNRELIGILSAVNPVCYNPEQMNPADDVIVVAGLIELYNEIQSGTNYIPWECIKGVLIGIVGFGSVIDSYNTLVKEGVSWATARGFLWKVLKKYSGWLTAAAAIYEIITKCF